MPERISGMWVAINRLKLNAWQVTLTLPARDYSGIFKPSVTAEQQSLNFGTTMALAASVNTMLVFLVGVAVGLTVGYFTGTTTTIHQTQLSTSSASSSSAASSLASPFSPSFASDDAKTKLLQFQAVGPTELRRKVSIVTELQTYLDDYRGRPSLPSPSSTAPKVFGLGLSKTGTTSVKEALRLLGIDCNKEVNIMNDFLLETFLSASWNKRDSVSVDIVRRYDDMASVVDLPLPYFFEELAQLYPDAKFILTVRDPASWWLSFKDHMERNHDKNRAERENQANQVRRALRTLHYGGESPSQYVAVKSFLRHNKLVQAIIPPERLLVLDVTKASGEEDALWELLCDFLGVAEGECPMDQDFPHANKKPLYQQWQW
ncbi:Sulfotransferase family protein [Balamuthia mandrillaris]